MFQVKKKKIKSIVGLDIEAGSIAATELRVNGSVEVARHGVIGLQPGTFREGEVSDPDALATALKQLFADNKLARHVRLGIANQRVAVRTLQLPTIEDASELETAIRFQAQDQIPMPLDQAVLDWEVIRTSAGNGEAGLAAVVVAARRDMLISLLGALRTAGLRPEGIDLAAFGMIRALAGRSHQAVGPAEYVESPVAGVPAYEERLASAPGTETAETPTEQLAEPAQLPEPAQLYCNLGDVTNLAVAHGRTCLFTRISPFGVEGIAQRLAERRQLTLEHARQWLAHVGLERPVEEIDGESETVAAARDTLAEGASKLADELRLSLEFYGAQPGAVAVEGVVACGPGTTIPGLVDRIQRDVGHPFQAAKPGPLAELDEASAARLTISYGLALEE